jgi:hypothetical protein
VTAALLSGCGGSDKKPASRPTPTPTPAETRSPAVAKGKAQGDLAVGLTEQNPNFVWAPGARPVPPEFARWQDDVGTLRPSFFRIVLDWPSLQPKPGTPPNLELPADGCFRGTPPCAAWAGVKDQLAALATRQKQHQGGWQALMVIAGTPDWAARPPSGCERSTVIPRSRAPKPSAMAAYRKLVEDVIALGGQVGVKLRYWSAWNEPNHPFFISPQRTACDAAAPDVAVERYAELTRNLKRALDDAPGDQEYVVGDLAGLDISKTKSTSIQEFLRKLPTPVVCGSTILSLHGYITGVNPVGLATRAAATHHCAKQHVVWMTETGVGAPHAGQDKRITKPAERRDCRRLHKRLLQWYKDPRVTAAFQYTFREDDIFRTGLVTTALDRAFPVLKEWKAWGGSARPDPTDPPPSHAHCSSA